MQDFLRKDFSKILKHNGLEARRLMRESGSNVARVYDRNLEGLDVTVDLYGPYARILDYGDEPLSEAMMVEVIDLVRRFLYIESDKVFYKVRKKRERGEQHEKEDESLSLSVLENGHTFRVELLKYVDTGLFLDQANTRKSVEEAAFGLKVLNLFSYTASFSVYAAAGGAESVDSVDLSNVYTAWGRENMDSNGFLDRSKYQMIASDAETFIESALKERRKWDLIIFDPPSFSNSHKAHDFDLKKDYLYYLYNFTKLLNDGGIVIFSENLSSFNLDKGRLKAYYKIKEVSDELRAFGFTKKRSLLRIFRLEKVKEFKGEVMKRIMDDDSLERLTLPGEEKSERKPRATERKAWGPERRDARPDYRKQERRGGYGIERGSFKDRRDRRDYPDSDRPWREKRRFDDRPGYPERRREERDGRRDYDRAERSDRDRRFDDRPRREYGDKKSDRPSRWNDERPRREGSYRSDRSYDERRMERRDRDERPRFRSDERGVGRRVKKAPVPYGYDEFRRTKGRDDENKDE